jgi:hypothetical protein
MKPRQKQKRWIILNRLLPLEYNAEPLRDEVLCLGIKICTYSRRLFVVQYAGLGFLGGKFPLYSLECRRARLHPLDDDVPRLHYHTVKSCQQETAEFWQNVRERVQLVREKAKKERAWRVYAGASLWLAARFQDLLDEWIVSEREHIDDVAVLHSTKVYLRNIRKYLLRLQFKGVRKKIKGLKRFLANREANSPRKFLATWIRAHV